MNTILFMVYLLISLLIIILVLAQKSKDNGFSTAMASSNDSPRGNTFERKMQNWTKYLVILYILLSISINFALVQDKTITKDNNVNNEIYDTEDEVTGNNDTVEGTDTNDAE